jgi:hypothetical protein
MKSLLALHAIASQRGDGLRPELLALLERLRTEAALPEPMLKVVENVRDVPSSKPATNEKD